MCDLSTNFEAHLLVPFNPANVEQWILVLKPAMKLFTPTSCEYTHRRRRNAEYSINRIYTYLHNEHSLYDPTISLASHFGWVERKLSDLLYFNSGAGFKKLYLTSLSSW